MDEDLTVLDVSDPADPRPIARATIPDTIGPRALSVDGDNVHLAQYWHGYWMVDLADLERPRVVDVTQWGAWHTTAGVDIGAGHAFALTEVRDVRVLSLADPTRPRPVGIGRAASVGGSIDVAQLPPVPTAIPPADGRERPYLPNDTLDVLAYDVDLTVPFLPPSTLDASVTIRLRVAETRAFIDLDINPETLDVSRVARGGTALPFEVVQGHHATARLSDAQLRIHLDAPLAAGDETELTIDYTIRQAIFDETPGLYYTHDFHGSQVMAAYNWPYYARRWLPSNDHPSDAATFTFDLRVPPDAIGAANGALLEGDYAVGSGVGDDGLRLFRWSHEQPIPTYATSIVVGTLNVEHQDLCFNTDDAGGEIVDCAGAQHDVPVVFYAPPDVPLRAQFDADLDAAARAIVYLSSVLGTYPYAKVGFTVSDHALFAMEYASLIAFARNTPGLAVHEVTHSWWGNTVRIGHWGDFWLSEGFTTYFTSLVREHESGEVTFLPSRSGRMVYPPDADPFTIYVESSAPYTKGASAVHDLRTRLAGVAGLPVEDAAAKALFMAVARDLHATYRYETLSSASLLAFLRANLGRHLAAHGHTVADAEIEALVADWAEAWYVSADTTVGARWDGGGTDLRAFDGDPDWLPQIIDVGPITERLAWFGLACNNEDGSPTTPEKDVTGKVALVERGGCTFNEKLHNASQGDARAVVMFTDQRPKVYMACVPTETLTCDDPLDLPAVMIDQTPGQALRDRLLAGTAITATLSSQRYDPMAP